MSASSTSKPTSSIHVSSATTTSQAEHKPPVAAIAGGAAGGAFVLTVIIALVIYYVCFGKKSRKRHADTVERTPSLSVNGVVEHNYSSGVKPFDGEAVHTGKLLMTVR
jgi:hypothetical protein